MAISDLMTVEDILYYHEHILEFIEVAILEPKSKLDGRKYELTWQQKEFIESAWNNKRTSVRSGKGVGKTCGIALLSVAFVALYPHAKVVITAPSSRTLKTATLPEIKKWIVGSHLEDQFELTAEKIYLKEDKSGNSFIEGRTSSKESPEALQGIHSDYMLLLVDEASNVPDPSIRAFINTLSAKHGKNHIAMISNPTRNIGEFYDSQMNDNLNLWKKYHFSALDSPITSEEQERDLRDKYGEDSNIYKCDVLGEFPVQDDSAFIGVSSVSAAMARDEEPRLTDEIHIGVDVARYGSDKTVLFWRQGMVVHEPLFAGKTSIPDVVNMTLSLVSKIRESTGYGGVIKIKVDDTGVGSGVTDYLKLDREHGIEVFPCNFGGKGNDVYQNEASMMWGSLKEVIDRVTLPNEVNCTNKQSIRAMKEELSARRADYGTGKIRIESKDVFKKEFGRSPDFADALVLCFFDKRSERSVVKDFDPVSKQTIIKKPSYMSDYETYASVFYSRDRLVSFLIVKYGNGQLIVTHENIGDTNISALASYIRNINPVGYRKIVANDRCFSKTAKDDVRGQMRKSGIRLRENIGYDELGAIELLNELTSSNKLKVLNNCDRTIQQLYNWKMDNSQQVLDTDFGLCYALLNVISELKEKIKRDASPEPVVREYQGRQTGATSASSMRDIHIASFR